LHAPLTLLTRVIQLTPKSTLFPYTTLFRSQAEFVHRCLEVRTEACVLLRIASQLENHPIRCQRSIYVSDTHTPSCRARVKRGNRSEEHTSELQSRENLVCRLLLEKKNKS